MEHILIKTAALPLEGIRVVLPQSNPKLKQLTLHYPCQPIENPTPHLGIGNSIALAIQTLPLSAKAALILLADQPQIHTEDLNHVLNNFQRSYEPKQTLIFQTKYKDGQMGHPTLFSRSYFQQLSELKGDVGAKNIIQRNQRYIIPCESRFESPPDIDTPDDYRRLLREGG
ncbi:molybdenum cofactor cytidylyltransferase [Ammoniphilus resinae]|uniref:Molybdenum cofactor cytidylyltransferase n=1 Tax=Ammoniphilus resinae TaxID=861532 RepID=A0ABS4GPC6_9BACL|nr:molybdenum cofactor cytidylyltransferase [Ammoniphilus resinae]